MMMLTVQQVEQPIYSLPVSLFIVDLNIWLFICICEAICLF